MEGIFNSHDLSKYLSGHISQKSTLTHKLSIYFKATQKNFEPDQHMLLIWLDYIEILEAVDEPKDIKATFYILRKEYYRYLEFWVRYIEFETKYYGKKMGKFVNDSLGFLESRKDYEGKKDIMEMLRRCIESKKGWERRSVRNNVTDRRDESDRHNVDGRSAFNRNGTDKSTCKKKDNKKELMDVTIYDTPSSYAEKKNNINSNRISCIIENEDYTESVTESLNKMMNSKLNNDETVNININNSNLNYHINDESINDYNNDVNYNINNENINGYNNNVNNTGKNKARNFITFKDKELEILGLIGKGGSSKVYKVKYRAPTTTSSYYALKVIKNVSDKKIIACYENEINLMLKVKGVPEMVELYDYYISNNLIMLLMEYGESDLSKILKEYNAGNRIAMKSDNGHNNDNVHCQINTDVNNNSDSSHTLLHTLATPDNDDVIFFIFCQLINILNVIYDLRIIHADIKPANILLSNGRLVLIDFGISKEISSNTTSVIQENKVGTINYMAPESLVGSKQSRRCDVWSVGVILYEMLYGNNFMDGMNVWQKMEWLKSEEEVKFENREKYCVSNNDDKKKDFGYDNGECIDDISNNIGDCGDGRFPSTNDTFKFLTQTCKSCLIKEPLKRPTVKNLLSLIKEFKEEFKEKMLVRKADLKRLVNRIRLNGRSDGVDQIVDRFVEEMKKGVKK